MRRASAALAGGRAGTRARTGLRPVVAARLPYLDDLLGHHFLVAAIAGAAAAAGRDRRFDDDRIGHPVTVIAMALAVAAAWIRRRLASLARPISGTGHRA